MDLIAGVIGLPILFLLASLGLPTRLANARVGMVRTVVTGLLAFEFLCALAAGLTLLVMGQNAWTVTLVRLPFLAGLGLDFYYDPLTGIMLLLVSFVSLIVSHFSIRYLNGEANQGRYFRWLSFTTGAVSLMVVAGSLLLFVVAWVMTSLGLHQLLLHYPHRAAARRAAWTKFAISRLGDAFLLLALSLTFQTYGTFQLSDLFAQASDVAQSGQTTIQHAAIGWLLVLGAVTKSAQFPFHSWLPETMETPTPVSALMHAGVVNAGGYLLIRMNHLVVLAPSALATLAVVGTLTALFAGVVMMTQTSVKRTLAYSTIAQMGFMMLQCGLGAFSAAMLHIVAHSLYKAHAFLGSGTVAPIVNRISEAGGVTPNRFRSLACLVTAAATTTIAILAIASFLDLSLTQKPGGVVLGFVLGLALTTWGWRLMERSERQTVGVAITGLILMSLIYLGGYGLMQRIAGDAIAEVAIPAQGLLSLGIIVTFATVFLLQVFLVPQRRPRWFEAIRIHAANGFYFDAMIRWLSLSLVRS